MTCKVTWIFNYQTVPVGTARVKTGGWSESWYNPRLASGQAIIEQADRWAIYRCALLPATTKIIGFRVGEVGAGNRSNVYDRNYAGTQPIATDIPQSALRFKMLSNDTENARLVVLRGIPDDWSKGGAVFSNPALTIALQNFRTVITSNQWQLRGRDFLAPQFPIISIANDGSYVLSVNAPYVAGDKVQVIRSRQQSTGRQVGGIFTIASVSDNKHGVLAHWSFGSTIEGAVRLNDYTYSNIYAPPGGWIGNVDIMTKKVGRAFFQYRGRRARR